MAIIEVEHLTKEFKLGQLESLKTTVLNQVRRLAGQTVEQRALFKALDDVSFSIDEGEVVGIIGHNGAGKSTLLKLLANISTPTSGRIRVDGRIAPLIEVGAGFIPELTGRENVYLNGSILGLSRKAIERKFDEIVDFAEMEEFIDTPVKRYSSGMKVKLAFSVATSIDSEILIVDEVLAVGDLAFQRKCFDRMESMMKRCGNTVLLVSHNIRQIERICNRAMLIDNGHIIANSKTKEVCEIFYTKNNEKIATNAKKYNTKNNIIRTSGEVAILSIDLLDNESNSIEEITSCETLRVRIKFDFKNKINKPEFIVGTHTTDFVFLSAASTVNIDYRPDYPAGTHEIEYIIDSYPMVSGPYCIRFSIFDHNRRPIFMGDNLKMFNVKPRAFEWQEGGYRTLDLPTKWVVNGRQFKNK